jgi:hypothetical protein
MSNEEQAFPSVEVRCKDRIREFCLNIGAFRAISERMKVETGKEKFDSLTEFNWDNPGLEEQIIILWAGFFTDARKQDKEPWTIEKCEEVVSILSLQEIEACITTSLSRVMSPAQMKKLESQKKTKTRKRGRPRKKRAELIT